MPTTPPPSAEPSTGTHASLEEILKRMEPMVPETIEAKAEKPLISVSRSLPSATQNTRPAIKDSPEARNHLTRLLSQTYALLKKYGERADVTEMRDAGFQMILADYPINDVEEAFWQYLKTNKDVPTPSDILAIVDPKTQPLCKEVYIRLSQKRDKGDTLDSTEWKYIRQYENEQYKRLK